MMLHHLQLIVLHNQMDLQSDSNADNPKDETSNAELLNSSDAVQNNNGDATAANDAQEKVEVVDVASGSPLPGMKIIVSIWICNRFHMNFLSVYVHK